MALSPWVARQRASMTAAMVRHTSAPASPCRVKWTTVSSAGGFFRSSPAGGVSRTLAPACRVRRAAAGLCGPGAQLGDEGDRRARRIAGRWPRRGLRHQPGRVVARRITILVRPVRQPVLCFVVGSVREHATSALATAPVEEVRGRRFPLASRRRMFVRGVVGWTSCAPDDPCGRFRADRGPPSSGRTRRTWWARRAPRRGSGRAPWPWGATTHHVSSTILTAWDLSGDAAPRGEADNRATPGGARRSGPSGLLEQLASGLEGQRSGSIAASGHLRRGAAPPSAAWTPDSLCSGPAWAALRPGRDLRAGRATSQGDPCLPRPERRRSFGWTVTLSRVTHGSTVDLTSRTGVHRSSRWIRPRTTGLSRSRQTAEGMSGIIDREHRREVVIAGVPVVMGD